MNLLEIRDLRVEFPRKGAPPLTVLNIPSFLLKAGAHQCLRGQSGSGKTTFLNVIAGLLTPTRGMVAFDGIDLGGLREAQRDALRGKQIGFVHQTFNLLHGFNALENVVLGSVFAGDPNEEPSSVRDRARKLLCTVGLKERLHHRPRVMSSGEQQRVAVARALINQPKLLLADEPTGSLDEGSGREVLDLIVRMASSCGAALLLVTHDPAVMARFDQVTDLREINRLS